jgi:hypothetical protein
MLSHLGLFIIVLKILPTILELDNLLFLYKIFLIQILDPLVLFFLFESCSQIYSIESLTFH